MTDSQLVKGQFVGLNLGLAEVWSTLEEEEEEDSDKEKQWVLLNSLSLRVGHGRKTLFPRFKTIMKAISPIKTIIFLNAKDERPNDLFNVTVYCSWLWGMLWLWQFLSGCTSKDPIQQCVPPDRLSFQSTDLPWTYEFNRLGWETRAHSNHRRIEEYSCSQGIVHLLTESMLLNRGFG